MTKKTIGPLMLDGHRFTKHTHGPKIWPWWRLVTVHVVRAVGCGKPPRKAWNIWIYTRWGAWCCGWYPERVENG